MTLLIKSAKLIEKGSALNGKTVDILIENGTITEIKSKIAAAKDVRVFEAKGLHVSIGWFDMQVNFCDPGYEHKEDLLNGTKAAAHSGFTGVAVTSNTNPPLHSKSEIEYVINKTQRELVDVYPIGAVSKNRDGKDMAELYDMHLSGAIAFSDDKRAVADAGLLLRALQYTKNFGSVIITHCDEKSISLDGKMNESKTSVSLGLKGIPALAEELMVARNIYLAEYTGGKIHISNVSTKRSVELIRAAKAKKIKITASVNAYNLNNDDSALADFDTNFKLNPPLREKADMAALQRGLTDGTIDVITSDHRPEDIENKQVEFDHAANGMIGLETLFALAYANKGKLKLQDLIEKITIQPRKILGIKIPKIAKGEKANITLFNPDLNWTLEEKKIFSRSKNSPYLGGKLKGKALAVYHNGKFLVC
jgi:dihydroorotase